MNEKIKELKEITSDNFHDVQIQLFVEKYDLTKKEFEKIEKEAKIFFKIVTENIDFKKEVKKDGISKKHNA